MATIDLNKKAGSIQLGLLAEAYVAQPKPTPRLLLDKVFPRD